MVIICVTITPQTQMAVNVGKQFAASVHVPLGSVFLQESADNINKFCVMI